MGWLSLASCLIDIFSQARIARRGHEEQLSPKLPSCPKQNLFDNFLTLFATNVPPKCHKWGIKKKNYVRSDPVRVRRSGPSQ